MDIEKSVAVRSLAQAKRVKRNYDAIITIEDPSFRKGLRFHNAPHPDQLVMWFEDVDHPWETVALPNRVHVETALLMLDGFDLHPDIAFAQAENCQAAGALGPRGGESYLAIARR